MRNESSHDSRSRERVAENLYRRTTQDGRAVYETKFRDVDGRWRSRTLKATTERQAIKEARALLARRDGGERVVPGALTLDQFAKDDYFPLLETLVSAGRRSERGVDLYRERYDRHIEPLLGSIKLAAVEGRHVSELIRRMRATGYAEATIAQPLVVLRAIFRLARTRRLVSRSPMDDLDPAELPRPKQGLTGRRLDEGELAALCHHAPEGYRNVVTLLAYTGLRLSEALGLRWCDIDFVEGELHVTGQLSRPKKGQPARVVEAKTLASVRIVPLWPAVERVLVDQLRAEQQAGRGRDGDFVFYARNGQPLEQRNVARRGVEAAAKAAGLGHVTPHDLRRSFCSLAGRRGVDPVEAAAITGHSLATWTKSYAASYGKAQRNEALKCLLEHGFGAVPDVRADTALTLEGDAEPSEATAPENPLQIGDGAYRDRTGDLRLAKPALSQLS
jgi:integrase